MQNIPISALIVGKHNMNLDILTTKRMIKFKMDYKERALWVK